MVHFIAVLSHASRLAPQDTLVGADGKEIKLSAPTGDELPARGFDPGA